MSQQKTTLEKLEAAGHCDLHRAVKSLPREETQLQKTLEEAGLLPISPSEASAEFLKLEQEGLDI